MKIEINTGSYNERRYGKHWIAKVEFTNNKGDFLFGDWVGQDGCEGCLILDNLRVGDVIAKGQKDTRKSSNSAPDFFILQADGSLGESVSKVDAYKHSQNKEPAGDDRNPALSAFSDADLLAELKKRGAL